MGGAAGWNGYGAGEGVERAISEDASGAGIEDSSAGDERRAGLEHLELRAGILREVKRLWASHGIAARVMKITLSTTEIKGTHRKWESKAE